LLRQIPYAKTRREAEKQRDAFRARFGTSQPKAVETLERDWQRMVTFFAFPKEYWKHLRTTNRIGSPCGAVRVRAAAGERYKKVGATPPRWSGRLCSWVGRRAAV